jgi:hypothetical protein
MHLVGVGVKRFWDIAAKNDVGNRLPRKKGLFAFSMIAFTNKFG